jgi:hypothetical protein
LIESYYNQLTVGYEVFKNRKLDLTKEGSYTSSGDTMNRKYITDMMDMFDDITTVYLELDSIIKKDDIIDKLAEIINTPTLEEASDIYKKYYSIEEGHLVIRLFGTILQNIIDNGTKDTIQKAMKMVEFLKEDVLKSASPGSGFHNKSVNTVQRMIQLYKLIPHGPSVPLDKIASLLNVSSGKGKLDSTLKKWAKLLSSGDQHISFIVISKITGRPMENKIWLLNDKKYLIDNNLYESVTYGVSNKSITRGNTLIDLPLGSIKKDDIIVIDPGIKPINRKRYYYILETVNGSLFRIMHPFNINPNNPIYKIPAEWFDDLTDIKKTPSTILENYNAALEGSILEKIKKPVEIERPDVNWGVIRQKIHQKALNVFKEVLITKLKKQKASEPLIASLITNPQVYQTIIHTIVDLIRLDRLRDIEKIPIEKVSYYSGEIMISYLSELDYLERSLAKKMDKFYNKYHKENIKRYLKGDIRSKAASVFSEILTKALEDFINNKSSIYATILNKSQLMKIFFS